MMFRHFPILILFLGVIGCSKPQAPEYIPDSGPEMKELVWGPLGSGDASDRMLEMWRRETVNPFPKPDNPDDLGTYVWGNLMQSFGMLLTTEEAEQANERIRRACNAMLKDDGSLAEEEHFHWRGNLLFRLFAMYTSHSTFEPGVLDSETEKLIEEVFWKYLSGNADFFYDVNEDMWAIWGSENHHLMKSTTLWSATAALAASPEYSDRILSEGKTIEQVKLLWDDYFISFFQEHFGKGLWIEYASPTYMKYSLQGLYNFYDFAEDDSLRSVAKACLDLHWAAWSAEQIDGMRGGSKIRSYSGPASDNALYSGSNAIAWYYTGIGQVPNGHHPSYACALSSPYRPPKPVLDLMKSETFDRDWVHVSRMAGRNRLQENGDVIDLEDPDIYLIDPELSGVMRTTRTTDKFVLGSHIFPVLHHKNWAGISSQNQWMGLTLPGSPLSLIHIRTDGEGAQRSTYIGHRSVQRGETLFSQALPRTKVGKYIWPLAIHLPESFTVEEKEGWFFVNAGEVFLSFRAASNELEERLPGVWMVNDRYDPLILQVTDSSQYLDRFSDFKHAVLRQKIEKTEDETLFYSSLSEDILFYANDDARSPFRVNGKPVQVESDSRAWDGPVLQQDWGSGFAKFMWSDYPELIISVRSTVVTPTTSSIW
jgi:hypothetical protein